MSPSELSSGARLARTGQLLARSGFPVCSWERGPGGRNRPGHGVMLLLHR